MTATDSALDLAAAPEPMARLLHYWQAKRRGRDLPARRDIDVLDLKPWLGRVNLHELHGDGRVRCRVRGSRFVVVPGYVATGCVINGATPAAPVALALARFRSALAEGRPLRHRIELGFEGARHSYDRLTLPLQADGALPPMVLAYLELDQTEHEQFWSRYAHAHPR